MPARSAFVALVATLAVALAPSTASATDVEDRAEPAREVLGDGRNVEPKRDAARGAEEEDDREDDTSAIGVLAGVGFPRPLAIEVVAKLGITMLGVEYGFLPTMTFDAVQARMWSAAGDLRVFPFGGAFFVGLRAGYQLASAEATLTATGIGSYTEAIEVGSWFLNPRIGFLWTFKPLAIGFDAGVQIPVATSVGRSSLLETVSPSIDSRVQDVAYALGQTPLPTIDLLRIGLVF